MKRKELFELLHQKYQDALEASTNLIEIIENLYNSLYGVEIEDEETSKILDSFIDGLTGCIRFRKMTFEITNVITYINITIMHIILWLNQTRGLDIDTSWYARRKSLESDLAKILRKSDSDLSANIRDRFGIRGILLNDTSEEQAIEYIYQIFDALAGILASKNRKMRKEFVEWFENNPRILELDKTVIRNVLDIPFGIDFVKDFISEPKANGYQSLQFTLVIQMYSDTLPGCQLEVQLRTSKMDEMAEQGSASHTKYKMYFEESSDSCKIDDEFSEGTENPINHVFEVDDFSRLHITGFTGYASEKMDADGIHSSKAFSIRRISSILVPKNKK